MYAYTCIINVYDDVNIIINYRTSSLWILNYIITYIHIIVYYIRVYRCHAIDEIDGMWVSPNNMFNYAIQIADNLF